MGEEVGVTFPGSWGRSSMGEWQLTATLGGLRWYCVGFDEVRMEYDAIYK